MTDLSVKSQSDLYRLLCVLDIPSRVAGLLTKDFSSWLSNNGPEWTVSRLKEFHQYALHLVGGDSRYRIPKQARIACHADGMPKGPWNWVLKSVEQSAASDRKLDSLFSVLKMYTGITFGSESPRQLDKFLKAVETPDPDKSNWDWHDLDDYEFRGLAPLWNYTQYDSLETWTSTPNKKTLHFEPGKNSYIGSVREVGLGLDQHRWDAALLSPSTIQRFYPLYEVALGKHKLPREFSDLLSQSLTETTFGQRREDGHLLNLLQARDPVVGKIGILQERGGKARFVANPLRVHQVAVSRLQNWLRAVAMQLPWDCTFDQGKGVKWMQMQLSINRTLETTDLSSFTDRFPLEVVTSCLKKIGPKAPESEFLAAVELQHYLASKGSWYFQSKKMPAKSFIKWTKGIPLGIYSCFLSAAITHGFILRTLELRLGLEDSFRVLGDDVIMTTDIAEEYKKVMSDMGAPCNLQKGLTSHWVGEFASKIACKERIIRSPKLPKGEGLFQSSKPLDLLSKYGRKAITLVPSRFREMVTFLASYPTNKGGLGWKPPKDSFTDSKVFPELFYTVKREVIHDVLPWETVRDGKSIIVYRKRLSDRLLELECSFGHLPTRVSFKRKTLETTVNQKGNWSTSLLFKKTKGTSWECREPIACSLVRKEITLRSQQGAVEDDEVLPSVELQWQIINANASLQDMEPTPHHEEVLLEAKEYPSVSHREFSLSEEELQHEKITRHKSLVTSKLFTAIKGYIVTPIISLLFKVESEIMKRRSK